MIIGTDSDGGTGTLRSTTAAAGSGHGFYAAHTGEAWFGNRGGGYMGITSGGTITLAGWTVDTNELKNSTNIGMNSSTKAFTINDTTFGNTGIQLGYDATYGGKAFIGKSNGAQIKFDGGVLTMSSSKFELDADGDMWLTDGNFSGSISAHAIIEGATLRTAQSGSTVSSHTTTITDHGGQTYVMNAGSGTP